MPHAKFVLVVLWVQFDAHALAFGATSGLDGDAAREVVKCVTTMEELLTRSGCDVFAFVNGDMRLAVTQLCERVRTARAGVCAHPLLLVVYLCGAAAAMVSAGATGCAGDDATSPACADWPATLRSLHEVAEELGGTLLIVADLVGDAQVPELSPQEMLYVKALLSV